MRHDSVVPTPAAEASVVLQALSCPKCGGSLEIREGAPLAQCGYCAGSFLVHAPGGTFRYLAPARITEEQARQAVRALFSSPQCAQDLAGGATRVSCEQFYVPFWRFRATFIGRVSGTKDIVSHRPVRTYHGDEEGSRSHAVLTMEEVRIGEEHVIEEIQQIWKATITACPLEDLGIPTLSSRRQLAGGLSHLAAGSSELEGLTLLTGEPGGEVLVDPMVDVEEARAEADAIFEKFVEGRGADLRETELQCERFQQRESLMFLPVYRVRFAYRGRLFEASVDGLEGHVVQARLPVDEAADLLPSLFAAAAGGLFIGAILRTAAMPPELLPELATWPGRAALFAIAAAGSFALRHLLRALAARLAAGGKDLVLNGH